MQPRATVVRLTRIELRQTEVEDLDHSVRGDVDVCRLEIAVHDPFLVCGVERIRDLARDGQCLSNRYPPAVQAGRQRFARNELEHEGADVLGFFESVDRTDVRVIERSQQPRLSLEPCEPLGICRERAWQDLDGHGAFELRIARPIHFSHATGANARLDVVDA